MQAYQEMGGRDARTGVSGIMMTLLAAGGNMT